MLKKNLGLLKIIKNKIKKYIKEDEFCFAEVISVKNKKRKINCYDLQVENTHSFLGNGIVNHNTTIIAAWLKLTNLPTLILTDRATLGKQLSDDLNEQGIDCGFCSGNGYKKGNCVVSTIQSVKKIGDLPKFKMVIVDECFPGSTKVMTEYGLKNISKLVRKKSTERVYSFNKETKQIELKPISNWFEKKSEYDTFIKIFTSKNNNVISTPNHKYYVFENNKIVLKRADELRIGDKICAHTGKDFGFKTVLKIKKYIPKNNTVYNITVDDNHNYFVGSGSKVLVSNCHKASSKSFQDFFASFGCPLKYGFSASPSNGKLLDFARIRQQLGSIIIQIKSDELMDHGVMAKAKINLVKTCCEDTGDYPSANDIGIVHNERRNNTIKNIVEKHRDGGYIAILVKNLDHGKILEDLIPGSVFLRGETSLEERVETIKKFNNGEVPVLIGSSILNEGVSISNMKVLIMAGGGKAQTQTVQKIGRVLRITKEKREGIFYDFIDDGNKYLLKHSKQRLTIYKKEGYKDIKLLDENLEEK